MMNIQFVGSVGYLDSLIFLVSSAFLITFIDGAVVNEGIHMIDVFIGILRSCIYLFQAAFMPKYMIFIIPLIDIMHDIYDVLYANRFTANDNEREHMKHMKYKYRHINTKRNIRNLR